jgi:hypothetical protein
MMLAVRKRIRPELSDMVANLAPLELTQPERVFRLTVGGQGLKLFSGSQLLVQRWEVTEALVKEARCMLLNERLNHGAHRGSSRMPGLQFLGRSRNQPGA